MTQSYGMTSNLIMSGLITNEYLLQLTPKYPNSIPQYGVQFVHGAGSSAGYCIDQIGSQGKLTSMIINEGYTGGAGDNGGPQTWGNDISVNNLNINISNLMVNANMRSGKVALVGASMGNIVALNYALANPTKVSCMVMVLPVINPEDIKANNRAGYAASINAAYGGAYNDASVGATKNPFNYRYNAALANIPMLIVYGLTDSLCLPTWTEQFAAAAPANRTIISRPSGHDFTTYDSVPFQTMLDFIKLYNV